MRLLCYLLLLLLTCSKSLTAQTITQALALHEQDSGLLTAGALDAAGNLYLASTLNLKTLPGEAGIAGIFLAGDPVLSKYAPDGTLLWRREFPGNVARFSDLAVTPEQNLVVTGGYVDTFHLGADGPIPGEPSNGSFFIAQLNPEGQFMWIDTHLSTLPEDGMGWTLALGPEAIFVAGMHDAIWSSLRRYDFNGELESEKIVEIRTISDLALDEQGHLYAVGTAAPLALFNNLPVPSPSIFTGYVSYIAQLDTAFQVQWIRSYNYGTFDEHPKTTVFDGKPVLLSLDLGEDSNGNGAYQLKTFMPNGDLIHVDSVLSGFSFFNYEHFALQSFCDRLLLAFPSENGFALRAYNADFQDTTLLQSSAGNFAGTYPFIATQGEQAVFGSNFRNSELTLSEDFTLHNSHVPAPQQYIIQMACENASTGSSAPVSASDTWILAPNPSGSCVYLNRVAGNSGKEVRVELLDGTGRLCGQFKTSADQTMISLEALSAGVYFLRIMNAERIAVLKGVRE